MINKVNTNVYKTSDGKLFESASEAADAQVQIDLRDLLAAQDCTVKMYATIYNIRRNIPAIYEILKKHQEASSS